MFTNTLIKTNHDLNLAHYYEHIVVNDLLNHLYNRGSLNKFDYHINGTTIDNVIFIELETTDSKTMEWCINHLTAAKVGYSKEEHRQATLEVENEESRKLSFGKEFNNNFNALSSAKWMFIESTDSIFHELSNTESSSISVSEQKFRQKKLVVNVELIKKESERNPLEFDLAEYLDRIIGYELRKFGFYDSGKPYPFEDAGAFGRGHDRRINSYLANDHLKNDIHKTILKILSEVDLKLLYAAALNWSKSRFNINHQGLYNETIFIFENTGVLISNQERIKSTTLKNIRETLETIKINIFFDGNRKTYRLETFLK